MGVIRGFRKQRNRKTGRSGVRGIIGISQWFRIPRGSKIYNEPTQVKRGKDDGEKIKSCGGT